jgi:hypothetical protein
MPVATSTIAVLAAGSTALNVYGSYQAGQSAKRQAGYEAAIMETQAGYSEQQAKDAIAIGDEQESRHRAAVRQLIGSQRATMGAQGIDLGSGSALDLQLEAAGMGELDATTIRNNARRQAWGFSVEASDLRNRAKMTRAGGRAAARAYNNQAVTTALSGAADIGGLFYRSSSTGSR